MGRKSSIDFTINLIGPGRHLDRGRRVRLAMSVALVTGIIIHHHRL